MAASADQLKPLRDAITHKPPYCSGTVSLPPESFTLFYGTKGNSERIDLSTASTDELERLTRACQPATFGFNRNDVLDETYRRARKMDTADFASKFDLQSSGIVDDIRDELLEGHDDGKAITAELYKLNVYEKDSFFKAHMDTPRSEMMFGSLVIVFPIPHEGGALTLGRAGELWTFDSDKATAATSSSVAYIAFYSDVEHEVQKVMSGYRVTLTYNLYFSTKRGAQKATIAPITSSLEETFKTALVAMLEDETFLPDGGILGFGLQHQYPVSAGVPIHGLRKHLKGTDAVVSKVCTTLSLDLSLRVAYAPEEGSDDRLAVTRTPVYLECDEEVSDHLLYYLSETSGATILRDANTEGKTYEDWLDEHIGHGELIH